MDGQTYAQIVYRIIKQQESVIGPMAVERAKKVEGLVIDWNNNTVSIIGDPINAIELLVDQYKKLFGEISVEVCREAASPMLSQLSPEQIPTSLR